MSYESELEFATQLGVALTYLVEKIQEHDEEYPLLTKALFTLLYGVVVESSGTCPHCGKGISITAKVPVGGIATAVDCLEEACQFLTFEIILEGGAYDEDTSSQEG